MSNQGIIYYNVGSKFLVRLCVSIHALRKVYQGPVTILHDDMESWVEELLDVYNVNRIEIPDPRQGGALVRKSQLWKYSPYDTSVYLDADTITIKPLDELFKLTEKHQFVTTHFADWKTTGGTMGKRIRSWLPVIGEKEVQKAIDYGRAINTGVIGWTKGAAILKEWDRITPEGYEKNCTRRLVDELACQVLLHKYPHHLVNYRYGCSVKHGPQSDPVIVHYHGSKHVHPYPICEHWKKNYWELRNTSKHHANLSVPCGDRRFKRFLSESVKDDLTIVTAVNKAYLPKMASNFHKWMAMPGIREQQFLIFINGFSRSSIYTRFLRKYNNVRLVPWDLPDAQNERELMLTSFVLGCAKEVKTPYWMKLDADCTPVAPEFVFPEYQKYTCCGHSWKYTKMKSDKTSTRHWLNILDDFFGGVPLFDTQFDPQTQRRVSHRRFCSFCYFEKTEFTRKLAEKCGKRLPIPSQDTLTWFAATKWGEPILNTNFKKYFSP